MRYLFNLPRPGGRFWLFAIGIFSAIFVFSSSATAQESQPEQYYRTFEVEVQNWTQTEMKSLTDILDAEVMKIGEKCSRSSKFLVSVDASYPKRVADIKSEIREKLNEIFPKRRITKITPIEASKTSTFCK